MRYLRQLDGLRAFAILGVLVEHFGGRGVNRFVPLGAGNLGVNLFFTLSGFLITGILMQAFDRGASKPQAWLNFYIRRVLRLGPLLYVTVALLALMHIQTMAQSWPWHMLYASNFYIASGGPKTVFWTLAVEEQFYLFWPFAVAFVPRRHLLKVAVGVYFGGIAWKILAHAVGIPQMTTNVMLPGSFEPIGMGCVLAVLCYRHGKPNQFGWIPAVAMRRFGYAALASAAVATAFWALLGTHSVVRYYTIDGMMAIVYGWVVLSGARGFGGIVGRVLEHPLANYLGRISYGVYVLHNWMPTILEKYAGPIPKAFAAPVVLVMTFGIAGLSYRFFETPIRDLGHRLRPPATPAAAPTGSFAEAVRETEAISHPAPSVATRAAD